MNGWQRLGVITSVAWFLAAWIYTTNALDKKHDEVWHSHYQLCRDRPHEFTGDLEQSKWCSEQGTFDADILSYGRT